MSHLTLEQAKRLYLAGLGLLSPPSKGTGPDHVSAVVDHLGFVQLDSINVLERAHHLIIGARMEHYRPPLLDHLVENERRYFEHWTHDASLIPMRDFCHWRQRFERFEAKIEKNAWWKERLGPEPGKLLESILQRVKVEGPLPTRSFRDDTKAREKWWGWTPSKAALELLWRSGRLMIAGRVGFEKVYDLPERVVPPEHLSRSADEGDSLEWACLSAIERLGVASSAEIAAFWHHFKGTEVKKWCDLHLPRVSVDGRALYARPDYRSVAPDSAADTLRLLAPFDPLVRDRARALWLFGFDYRFEAFVPEKKRKYGYYVLPILDRDSLVGRLDAKHHRKEGRLEIKGLWWESGVRVGRTRIQRLERALRGLARRVEARSVSYPLNESIKVL